jgi:hypothetical protein
MDNIDNTKLMRFELSAVGTGQTRVITMPNANVNLGDIQGHIDDAVDAHDASAISYAGGPGTSATDVEGALDELSTEKSNTTHTHPKDYPPWAFKGAVATTLLADALSMPIREARTLTEIHAILTTTGSSTTTVAFHLNGNATAFATVSLTSGTKQNSATISQALAVGDYVQAIVSAAGTGAKDLVATMRAA